jgi:hypothetical protein
MTKTLSEYQQEIYDINVKNGWFDDERQWGDDVALLHSEVSEAFEAFRDWGTEDRTRALCMHEHEEDSWDGSYCHPNHLCKPQGVANEFADVLVRVLDSCQRNKIDIEDVNRLADGNTWQSLNQVSFGTQMAWLHKEISKLLDEDKDVTFTFSFILSLLRDLNAYHGFDMYGELERKMAYNATRGYRHGNKRV